MARYPNLRFIRLEDKHLQRAIQVVNEQMRTRLYLSSEQVHRRGQSLYNVRFKYETWSTFKMSIKFYRNARSPFERLHVINVAQMKTKYGEATYVTLVIQGEEEEEEE